MPKPSSFEELLARVEGRIRSPNEAKAESTLVHGEVSLDLLTRRAAAAGIEHDLTAREFTMLEFFLRHPRQVISREQLLSRAWGLGHDPASNVVDVYIRYLRQKPGNDLIHEVRGRGYRLG
jgi:DNA-binding response OmpR family regulator